tara:strand:+ start:4553 stop:6511 length:1959 start_codon:yes stop_codon:yes gene_type:complete
MALGILVLITALSISAVAIYYSIAGLVAIFAAAALPIMVMGGVLEVGKLVTAVWLHKYWKQATWWLKYYLATAVVVLMFITSMGIFGFLSKAHIEQTSAGEESVAQVQQIESEVTRLNAVIKRADDKVKALETSGTGSDANVQSQIDKEQVRIDDAYTRIQPAIDEQNAIIANVTSLFQTELDKIDKELQILQGYVDNNEIKKAQQMIGASADGVFGKKTAEKIGDWKSAKQAERAEWLNKIQQSANSPTVKAARTEIQRLRSNADKQIAESNKLIDRLRSQLGNTDQADEIDAAVDIQLAKIKTAETELDTLVEEKYKLEGQYRMLEAEVGPIKYIAEFVYGETADNTMLEEAVRWVILIIIFVFDPLAVLLLIASQYTFDFARKNKKDKEWKDYENTRGNMIARNEEPKKSDAPEEEPKYEDVDQATLDKEFDDEFVGLEDEYVPNPEIEEEYEKRKERYERVMAPHRSKDEVDQTKEWQELYEEVDKPKQEFNDEFGDMEELTKEVDKDGDGIDDNTGQPITGIGAVKGTFADAGKKKDTESPEESKDLESWNKWVAAAEEEVTKETIDKRVQEVASQENDKVWNDAKRKWKEENPNQNAKDWKHAYISGRIHELPWATLVNNEQEGYVQNAEQSESSVWNKLQDSDNK